MGSWGCLQSRWYAQIGIWQSCSLHSSPQLLLGIPSAVFAASAATLVMAWARLFRMFVFSYFLSNSSKRTFNSLCCCVLISWDQHSYYNTANREEHCQTLYVFHLLNIASGKSNSTCSWSSSEAQFHLWAVAFSSAEGMLKKYDHFWAESNQAGQGGCF